MPRSLPPSSHPESPPPAGGHKRGPTAVHRQPVSPGSPEPLAGAGLPMPHEHDEATGEVDARPHPVVEQAKRDVDAGLVDTDMRSATGLADAAPPPSTSAKR